MCGGKVAAIKEVWLFQSPTSYFSTQRLGPGFVTKWLQSLWWTSVLAFAKLVGMH